MKTYYGKGDVIVYRLNPDGVFGANVLFLIHGDAFQKTYTTGDNTGLIATDSMKNFIQRETANFAGWDLESYCQFIGDKFLAKYPQADGVQISASEIPYSALPGSMVAFAPAGPDRATARLEIERGVDAVVRSGIAGFRLLRLGGSSFQGFVRDEYTTLPDIANRPLHMWLDLDWSYVNGKGAVTARVRKLVHEVFNAFESGSIQQIIYQLGVKILDEVPEIAEVHLEANNRTWDMVAEGVYTEARPPYGCLGLTLHR